MERIFDRQALGKLDVLQEDMVRRADVCSSGGVVTSFPERMTEGFRNFGIGLIVCHEGRFDFTLSDKRYTAGSGETVFIPEGTFFRVEHQSADLRMSIIIYRTAPIRDVVGTMVQSVNLYAQMSPDLPCVWRTECEDDIAGYIYLIGKIQLSDDDLFAVNERKLLLLSLTYRLCSVFSRQFFAKDSANARRTEIFLRLIRLIDRNYMAERGVAFYADKLCLSAKYLSELSKSVCGYTVQELVFKAITRKAMSLLDSTNKTVAEISDEFHFPNPSSFGTFFRKQTGLSPQKYRDRL